ncbi:LOW QUALITY PROTEIN: probable LRR receptor-like serine/threonine-protein kinase At1g53420 [Jatropha curcas]|uniref:LOW QUALITY PROTEIN: probable LRR receptor-like serine/threonine-protein kinase At1g53420 n=1 Tax=Jatropha curcas TaxID=180498 RepID=UPI001893AA29|nr:LOW QUALITY PROTEIN: probable LRR receptor-like serine/threonine-protein kinase At1g53420 [Jatropha curcas]
MCSKLSVRALLIPILTFLLQWQLVHGADKPYIARNQTLPCDRNQNLPCDELDALTIVLSGLGVTKFSDSHCQNSSNLVAGAEIRCNCSFKDKDGNFTCHITEINKRSSSLSGYMDDAISGLQHLQILDLSSNQLTGSLPQSMGNLTSLTDLYLSSNQLTGSLPQSMGNLTSLTYLNLANNQLEGTIPSSFQALNSLKYLDLSLNFLNGPMTGLGNLQNLIQMYLEFNFLNQSIPKSFGNLLSLETLNLDSNMLSGPIPDELGNLTQLDFLYAHDNELTGPLPEALGKLNNITSFGLNSNNLTGKIPQSYSQLTGLQSFAVAGNYLSGPIHDYIANWKYLTFLYLLGNNFEGNLPEGIFKLPHLEELWVSGLTNPGFTFPRQADLMTNIYSLVLRNCSINGTIPSYIAKWPELTHLDLSFNNLTGEIQEFGTGTKHVKIFLSRNKFNGKFPQWIIKQSYGILELDVSYNDFTNMPKHENGMLQSSSNTIIIEPTREYIYQKGKKCPKKTHSLSINCGGDHVDFDKQSYENDTAISNFYESPDGNWAYSVSGGAITPTTRENLTCGVSVPEGDLYVNARVAPIFLTYYAFCLRKGKYNIKLFFAETSFSKKEDYSILKKRIFEVHIQGKKVLQDFNIQKEAEGAKYKTIMKSFTAIIPDHEPLQIDFFWAGRGSLDDNGPLVSAISITRAPRKLKAWEIVAIAAACVLFLFLLLAFLWRMGWIGDRELHKTRINLSEEQAYSVKEIINATQKFSPKTKIGKDGRFGIVYKAILPNLTVAVKKLFPKSKAAAEIRAEVFALSNLGDQNLVKLLGSYSKRGLHLLIYEYMENLVKLLGSYSKRGLHLLIYEYMENGSLEEVLFDANCSAQLSWEKRYKICEQIALGLEFLHKREPAVIHEIIHRNIKASNILLDRDYNAKISDFGLAKLYEEDDPFMFTKDPGSTLKYMAPEYVSHNNITVKVDVYSFGLLLLEIISGKKIDENLGDPGNSIYLLEKADMCRKQKTYEQLIDETLKERPPGRVSSAMLYQAITIVELAMLCTDWPSKRPPISDVVSVLQGEKTVKDMTDV